MTETPRAMHFSAFIVTSTSKLCVYLCYLLIYCLRLFSLELFAVVDIVVDIVMCIFMYIYARLLRNLMLFAVVDIVCICVQTTCTNVS